MKVKMLICKNILLIYLFIFVYLLLGGDFRDKSIGNLNVIIINYEIINKFVFDFLMKDVIGFCYWMLVLM